ncbi:MAG: hypothetical protein KIT79_11395 [Deltaproteobacteria bacterium]|nr:hypothetical protein [Deltaproteobacteria bacterium]
MAGLTYNGLAQSSNSELEAIFLKGVQPQPEQFAGYEFRGFNTPLFARLLGIQKFIKGMFRNREGQVEGYNIPVRQNGLEGPWEYKTTEPKRFGFYDVYPVRESERDRNYPNSTLLNYGSNKRNGLFDPWVLRDYMIQPDPANPDLFIGKAYIRVGPICIPSNFFILERLSVTEWKPE